MNSLPVGKLPAELLKELLHRHTSPDPRVIVGPGVGRDAALIDMGDRYLAAKTDPVTFATEEIGWYAVHVNANDIACCGAVPRWFLATILLPEDASPPESVESIFRQIGEACRGLDIAWCGGHTEITEGLDRPIVAGQMLGEVAPEDCVTSDCAEPGDVLILTKGIAIEGTAIMALEKRDALRGVVSEEDLDRCAGFLHEPGISVVRDARIALEAGGVHALHDPTEGGLATGLREIAEAAGVGLVIDEDRLPILPECATFCRQFGLDPLGLIGSGSLLIAAEPHCAEAIVQRLVQAGIAASVIGKAVPADDGLSLRGSDGTSRPLPTFARDEIARVFE